MDEQQQEHFGSFAAEHLSPSFPQRAPWGTAQRLRAWQAEALDQYFAMDGPDGVGGGPRDFLAAATPGAGKTTFALRLATELLRRRIIDRIVVVAPTEHLKTQWADAAARVSIRLDPNFSNRHVAPARHYHGVAVTYAQVAVKSSVHQRLTEDARTLVILDEVHHGGDALSWGEALRESYHRATRRLLLSGTPFRSDTAPIPFVEYHPNSKGIRLSRTDYNYGYGRALADGVVRPVLFLVYAGQMRWRTKAGDEYEAHLGQDNTKDINSQAWRTALDPQGDWIPAVLRSADRRLSEVRQEVPDAGGLVIATDQTAARAYAAILRDITGEPTTVVLSDDPAASGRIEEFGNSTSRWMVAVRMVSEGVDVPRLAVGVYATSASTPLFFAQAIGRFVRARRRGESASVFLPNVPPLLALANELERERDHALDRESGDDDGLEDTLLAEAERDDKASDSLTEEFTFQALGSVAHFDRVLFDGKEFGQLAVPGTPEEEEFLGLPGLLEPEHVHELLMQRQARQSRHRKTREAGEAKVADATGTDVATTLPPALHRTLKEQRQLLNSLVGVYARQSGEPHGAVHAELRRLCGGPAVSHATVAQLQARIELLRRRVHS
ncbi:MULTISPECIES: DEAD/DEAH box helicase [unclassified Microbacterium]|uniref:DEAD/DEAH box helicase n=1 Tax=unclassified Microbacterium TaxID=2609290 RepID=UPI00214B9569|nr:MULTISPECIES: DEAD/DEAH box helicase [unclassified Microbacterium]MCR2785760.1 DEAD/DEAH box helicase [Microbacterium sp. zg.B96]WIM17257.1 DEAD/DEAH box helicase [Microbacterium sp. zg-B96]